MNRVKEAKKKKKKGQKRVSPYVLSDDFLSAVWEVKVDEIWEQSHCKEKTRTEKSECFGLVSSLKIESKQSREERRWVGDFL